MDIELVSQRDLDVAHEVSGIRFQYYSEEDIKRLSVRRITRERAFDDFGRPAPRGLYDPALGVLSYGDGACETCGSSYDVCPGHFGHIELPFPIVNPLLTKIVGRLLASSCWECGEMRISKPARDALLAELYFEDAGLPKCVHACEFFFSGAGTGSKEDKRLLGSSFATFFDSVPSQIKTHIRGVDIEDQDECSRAILTAAKLEWERAAKAGRLLPSPSAAWVRMLNGFERIKHGQCPSCGSKSVKVRAGKVGRIFRINSNKSETLLSPTEIDDQMQLLWASARKICELFYGHKGRIKDNPLQSLDYTVFFVRCVAVPPNRFRPSSKVGTMEVASEHPQNLCFSRILEGIAALVEENKEDFEQVTPQIENGEGDGRAELLEGEPAPTKKARNANEKKGWRKFKRTDVRRERDIAKAVTKIQDSLSYLYDNDPSERTVKLAGIRQQLEAKAGLFRQHMMGKRVNFSCRSVIGPDVFLGTDEIGIPQSFARLLTIPEPVTALNLDKMRQAVLNGPHKHPGATAVEYWTNSGVHKVTMLTQNNRHAQAKMLIQNNAKQKSSQTASTTGRGFGTSEEQTNPHNGNYAEMEARSSSILPRRVLRHVRNGDIVLFNRQPTLHRVSIMAHKVRVLPENRTIRFHYANCGSYNADFDGDEMNVHVPQDVLARTEAEELMLSSRHYIVPTSGSPIRGLIQDHVAGAALLSRRDMFLRKAKFCQLLFSATDCITSKPSYKGGRYRIPIPAILKPQPLWTGKQLLSSVLDIVRGDKPGLYLETRSKTKANIVGQEEAEVLIRGGQLLRGTLDKSSLGATIYGAVHGVQEVYGTEASDNFLSCLGRLCTFFLREHGHTTGIDDLLLQSDAEQKRHSLISNALDGISISCTNAVYEALGTDASGDVSERLATTVHDARSLTEEMVSLYGIEAEDRLDTAMKAALNEVSSNVMNVCLPGKLQKRFPENGFSLMTSTGAKGSAVNSAQISCLVGSTVLEGRRVPRMGGSGATLPCFPPYDPSPNAGGYIAGRFLTGMAPFEFYFHAMAGREGLLDTSLKTANSGYLQRCLVKHLEGIKLHYDYTVRDSNGNIIQFLYGDDGIDPTKASWLMTKIDWQVKNIHCLRRKISARDPAVTALLHSRKKDKEQGIDVGSSRYPSVLEKLSPGVFSKNGAVSEEFRDEMERYVAKNGCDEDIISFLESRYQDAVAEPGEPVGIIAAQGVGEPSTQMTLNTFHHAGSSSAHVTLGIPRLRELIMTAAKYPKTPSMTIPILPEAGMKGAKKLAQRLSFVCLADLLLSIEVQDKHMCFLEDMGGMAVSIVGLVLRFPEPKLYEEELGVTFKKLSDSVNDEFMDVFNELLRKDVMRSERLVGPGSGLGKVKRLIPRVLGRDDLATEENVVLDSDRDEDSVNGENESSGKSKKGKRGKKKTSKSVSKSAGLSDEDASGGDSASDSNMSDNESDSEFSDEPEGEELDSQEEADEAVDIDEDVERLKREERELAGYDKKVINEIGPLGEAEASEDGTSIEITWIVPLSLTGRVDVAEVAREAAKKIKLVHVEGITKCFTEATSDGPVLVTEGSNLEQVFILGHGAVDYNRVLTNNMLGILKTYGVEALRLALIQEFRKVFDAYGIPVNIRHLNLIADYMTVNGTYRGFNRRSIDDAPSPFQKMTFETSVKFLSEAALYGTKDSVRNPSAAIAVGATYSGGTGGIDLLQPLT